MWCPWAFPTTTGRDRVGQARFDACTSLVPKPITVVIGLGTKLDVRMRTRLENGVLRNGQQPGSPVNSHSKFEAMKSLSGWKLRALTNINFVLKSRYLSRSRVIVVWQMVWTKSTKKGTSLPHTFAYSCLPHGFLATIMSLADHNGTQTGSLGV